jgi:UDP-N-acetyl-alpha-D-muramoyl-L-alanyl-L-glutamate epimerase
VFGNERSADEPTRVVDGTPVNHQHSKSLAFEVAFARAIAPTGLAYFSLLRRLSGLSVAGLVATDGRLVGSFLSCNRAFKRSRADDDPQTWCLECPKCLSTFLLFACFLSPREAEATFGGNPLAVPARAQGFAELWDTEAKPFECVAELAESAVAMAWLAEADGWRTHAVVASLGEPAAAATRSLDATMEGMLRPAGDHGMPDGLAAVVDQAAAAVRARR